jgi:hypothetical protein
MDVEVFPIFSHKIKKNELCNAYIRAKRNDSIFGSTFEKGGKKIFSDRQK